MTASSYSFVKNIFVFVGFVMEGLKKARASRTSQPNVRPPQQADSLDARAVKLLKKLMINGANLIQKLHDVLPSHQKQEKELAERFDLVWLRIRPSYFRDLLHACGDEIFGMLVYVKATQCDRSSDAIKHKEDVGICHFMSYALEVNANGNLPTTDCNVEIISHYLELFAKYLIERSKMFSLQNEFKVPLCGLSPSDRKLAQLPYGDV
jgi:hypothetical protein